MLNKINLTNREKTLVQYTSVVVVLVVLFLSVDSARSTIEALEKKVDQQHTQQLKIENLVLEISKAKERSREKQQKRKSKIKSLLTWLEREIAREGIKGNLQQISPVSTRASELYREKASLKLTGLAMKQAVILLNTIEKIDGLEVVRGDLTRLPASQGGVMLVVEIGAH